MTFDQFLESIGDDLPNQGLSVFCKALWHDAKGEWHVAHNLVDGMAGSNAAWVHAYLHRKEGDRNNANYWYHRANEKMPELSLDEEWQELYDLIALK